MSTKITSAAIVKAAQEAQADALSALFDAYAATAADREGNKDSEISAAWQASGVRPASVAMVGYYARAARLTAHRTTFLAVVEDVYGDIIEAHRIIMRCQKARKAAHVDGILAALDKALAAIADDATVEDREAATVKALTRALRDLKAGATPRKADPNHGKGDTDKGDTDTDAGTDEETVEDTDTETDTRTPWETKVAMLAQAATLVLEEAGGTFTEAQAIEISQTLKAVTAQVRAAAERSQAGRKSA